MHISALTTLASLLYLSLHICTTTSIIVTTKITPAYWHANFSSPPLNLEGAEILRDLWNLVDAIGNSTEVKVVVFGSAVPDVFLGHFDFLAPFPAELLTGYWKNFTRLADLPVLTVAAIRGTARAGGTEIASLLDVRFGSREKAVLSQLEVGFGEWFYILSHKS